MRSSFPARLLTPLALLALAGVPGAQGLRPGLQGPRAVSRARTPDEVARLGARPFLEGQVIVRLSDRVPRNEAFAELTNDRFVIERELMGICDLYLVQILDGRSVANVVPELAALPAVEYVVPDHLVEARRGLPDDPSFASQWALDNRGQTGGVPGADIGAVAAWDVGTGSKDFVVAIVDEGTSTTHPDLVDNLWRNEAEASGLPGVDDDGNGYVDDVHGWNAYQSSGDVPSSFHGAHVTGIAGATGRNGKGITGVCWDVSLLPVAGSSSTTAVVLRAYDYLADQKDLWLRTGGADGANVVVANSSFGIDLVDCSSPAYRAWNDAYDALGALGILSTAATANRAIDVDVEGDVPTTCTSPYLVAVTNTTHEDLLASNAAHGATSIDLGAPGSSILSTVPGGGYSLLSGTSMASPHVAGAIALLHSVAGQPFRDLCRQDPAAAALLLKDLLLANVTPLPSLAGVTTSGGRLDLEAAARALRDHGEGASVVSYGEEVGGANVGTLGSEWPALEGQTMVFDVGSLPNATLGSLRFSVAPAAASILGGTLLIASGGTVAQVSFALVSGEATIELHMPLGIAGSTFYAQAIALDSSQVRGVAFTNGLRLTFGL